MPRTVALPNPLALAWMSVWYQEMPNGAVGCWMTNRSKPVLAGMPCRLTVMVSLRVPGVMVARPPALGRHAEIAAEDGLSGNENDGPAAAGRAGAPVVAAPAEAVRLSAAAAAPAAATATALAAVGARMLRIVGRVLLMVVASRHVGGSQPPFLFPPGRSPGQGGIPVEHDRQAANVQS